jgi:succinate dehydrogenase/fumarate reductase flavoprotein subunit
MAHALDPVETAATAGTLPEAEPIAPLPAPQAWDESTDVVIIGSGGAGMTAALYLSQKGVKVTLVEKNPGLGGVTGTALAWLCPGGTKAHEARGITEYDVDEKVKEYLGYLKYPANGPQRRMLRQSLIKGPQFFDWFIDLGAPMMLVSATTYVSMSADKGTRAINAVNFAQEKATGFGADFRLYSQCTGLVQQNGRVTGARIQDLEGKREYFIEAKKAVLLASGGFTSNFDMLKRWCPTVINTVKTTATFTGDDGSMTRMAQGMGANMMGWDSFLTFCGGLDVGEWNHRIRDGDVQVARQPWLGIDITGSRYPYVSSHDPNDPLWNAFYLQAQILQGLPGSWGYVFFDSNWLAHTLAYGEKGCREGENPENTPRSQILAIDPESWTEGVERAIERGHIKTSDDFTQIATELGLDPAVVLRAVDDWNAICEKGVDEEFGYEPQWLKKLERPPYFGMKLGSNLLSTQCGLQINADMQVIDTQGKPIEGLYASSTTIGGMIGNASNGGGKASPYGSNALTWLTGYMAAQGILGERSAS